MISVWQRVPEMARRGGGQVVILGKRGVELEWRTGFPYTIKDKQNRLNRIRIALN